MNHVGDITKINGYTVDPANVVIGGSPCQDLSIAGNRAGLAGERSGLFMEQIRVIKEMRDADVARGRTGRSTRPRWMVWENVPGAFSSNGGEDFAAVLYETIKIACPQAPAVSVPDRKRMGGTTSGCYFDVDGRWSVAWRVFDAQFWGVPQRRRRIALVADFGGLTAPEILFERQGVSGDSQTSGAPAKTTSANAGECTTAASHRSTTYCIQGNCIDRADTAGCNGKGWTEGVSYTLNTIDRPAVLCLNDQGGSIMGVSMDKTGTLRAQEHGHQPIVCMGASMDHAAIYKDKCPTLCCGKEKPIIAQQQLFENHAQDSRYNGPLEVSPTVTQRYGTGGGNTPLIVRKKSLVRRITPLECERLQGFPDGWTDIGPWVDSKGKLHKESSDSSRYKALGNSIALPPWAWVLSRLSTYATDEPTMASLFDGIGGFPLLWERINGKGSCLWASEIEEFPVAVTKYHFGNGNQRNQDAQD